MVTSERRLEQFEFLLGVEEGLLADTRGLLGRLLFGSFGCAVFGAEFLNLAIDASLGEADGGIDKSAEFVSVGEEAVAKFPGVGFGKELAEVCGDDLDECLTCGVGVAGLSDDGGGQFVFCLDGQGDSSLLQPVEVATGFPVAEVVLGEADTVGAEAVNDGEVRNAVLHHGV